MGNHNKISQPNKDSSASSPECLSKAPASPKRVGDPVAQGGDRHTNDNGSCDASPYNASTLLRKVKPQLRNKWKSGQNSVALSIYASIPLKSVGKPKEHKWREFPPSINRLFHP